MTNSDNEQVKTYQSVGGWLLLLCLALTIFSPLRSLYNLVTAYSETLPFFDEFPGLEVLLYLDGTIHIRYLPPTISSNYRKNLFAITTPTMKTTIFLQAILPEKMFLPEQIPKPKFMKKRFGWITAFRSLLPINSFKGIRQFNP